MQPFTNTLLGIVSLVHPDRVIVKPASRDEQSSSNPSDNIGSGLPLLRQRLSRNDIDIIWWWLFEKKPQCELEELADLSADDLALTQQRIGRRLHAQTLIERYYGADGKLKLRKPGKDFLQRRVIDGRPLDRAMDMVRRQNESWQGDAVELIRDVEPMWQAKDVSLVPDTACDFDWAAEVAACGPTRQVTLAHAK